MKKKNNGSGPKGANWMDTYGDMVTLLLTFFVLLYSFSSVDSSKWDRLVAALSGSKGVLLEENVAEEIANPNNMNENEPNVQEMENNLAASGEISTVNAESLYQQLKAYIDQNSLSNDIVLTRTGDEIRIRFTSNVLFDLGKANIKSEAFAILDNVSYALMTYNQTIEMVRIEGHTDNWPISTKEFPSNWELSTTRAVNVLRYLIENNGLPSNMLSAVGYGEYHPFADNSTEEGRRMNRRVDFVINVLS